MDIYLPIAEMSVNLFLLIGMGAAVGFLSGMFGVGGGFLMTPLLIFIGIPPPVAVASEANQITAASVSGLLAHWRRGNVDFKMGWMLMIGGAAGAATGVWVFRLLRTIGQLDFVILATFVAFLGGIGILMAIESLNTMRQRARGRRRKLHQHNWLHGLPLKVRFRKSKLYISAILPVMIGYFVGMMAAIMGVGGGFIMIPAMIYILGMPTSVVVGTSLFQIMFVTAIATVLHAVTNQTVDVLLSFLLMLGAVFGAQIGTSVSGILRGEQLRALLAAMVLAVCGKLIYDLVATPGDLYSLGVVIGQ